MALQQFFEEQSLEYTSETVDTIRGKVYKVRMLFFLASRLLFILVNRLLY
jgi:hypothetical protein